MKQFLFFLIFFAAMLGIHRFSQAQDDVEPNFLSLHFEACLGNPDCTRQEQLQLIWDTTNTMRIVLQNIHHACARVNYENCISPQMDEVILWHKMHVYMADIMQVMELQYTAGLSAPPPPELPQNLIAPAVGLLDEPLPEDSLDLIEPAMGP